MKTQTAYREIYFQRLGKRQRACVVSKSPVFRAKTMRIYPLLVIPFSFLLAIIGSGNGQRKKTPGDANFLPPIFFHHVFVAANARKNVTIWA